MAPHAIAESAPRRNSLLRHHASICVLHLPGRHRSVEKVRYLHRNLVRRSLVEKPEDWEWSSFRHYLDGTPGVVEIESHWTARQRERLGIVPQLKIRETPPGKPTAGLRGAPSGDGM